MVIAIDTFCEMMESGTANKFLEIDGFGETMYQSLVNWKEKHWNEFLELKKEFKLGLKPKRSLSKVKDKLLFLLFCRFYIKNTSVGGIGWGIPRQIYENLG